MIRFDIPNSGVFLGRFVMAVNDKTVGHFSLSTTFWCDCHQVLLASDTWSSRGTTYTSYHINFLSKYFFVAVMNLTILDRPYQFDKLDTDEEVT